MDLMYCACPLSRPFLASEQAGNPVLDMMFRRAMMHPATRVPACHAERSIREIHLFLDILPTTLHQLGKLLQEKLATKCHGTLQRMLRSTVSGITAEATQLILMFEQLLVQAIAAQTA